ncbi:hypothetical protein FVE85_0360 [Porphyridium purpureum]|uniref:Uncharacterized protein n=1 Tax=Porphyridium purpureum TaxID=35688 RepID=A0A5J4YYE4_PORPP|nr:hypothetical protein FVE85_0360 [Porphyridium purpureum]|eukprot:POR7457..scf208_2
MFVSTVYDGCAATQVAARRACCEVAVMNIAAVRFGRVGERAVTRACGSARRARQDDEHAAVAGVDTAEPAQPKDVSTSVEERVVNELAQRGIDLEELLNPSKVINLERKIESKKVELAALQDDAARALALTTEISKLEKQSEDEKRQVMFEWLKTTFAVQGVLGLVVGGALAKGGDFAHDSNVLSAAFFQGNEIPLVARALGFWLVWMFTIPSLRARKPSRTEKAALNMAFAAVPIANVAAPFITKDPWVIYCGDLVLLAACYAFYFVFKMDPKDAPKLRGKWKWLDWSSRM